MGWADAKSPFKDAVLGPDMDPDYFHVSTVKIYESMKADSWKYWSLTVHFYWNSNLFNPTSRDKEATEFLREGNFTHSLEGNLLSVVKQDKVIYTVDISPIVSTMTDAQEIEIYTGVHVSQIIILVIDKAFSGVRPHVLSSKDLNPEAKKSCGVKVKSSISVSAEDSACQRPVDHLGGHQFIVDRGYGDFTSVEGASFNPHILFGLPVECNWCGFVLAGSGLNERYCHTCSFWKGYLDNPVPSAMVIDGSQYIPGAGGFYGHVWHVVRNDGSKWSGQLMTQGAIPQHLRSLFPDTARFVEDRVSV